MVATSVKLLELEGGEDVSSVTYKAQYLVHTDDRDDGPFTARNAVPWHYGDPYVIGNDSDPRAVATGIRETQASQAHPLDWYVDVDFAAVDNTRDLANPTNNAIAEEVSWNGVSRITYLDAAGNILANTAGVPYQNGAEVEDNRPTLSYSLNQLNFPFALAQQVRNAVNSDVWKGYPAGTVKVESMAANRKFHKVIGIYYEARYNFLVNPEGFLYTTPSYGLHEKTGFTLPGKRHRRIMRGGKPITEPWPLDDDGEALDNLTDAPAIQNFTIYPTLSFNALFPFL
jgi:hypothetical protein